MSSESGDSSGQRATAADHNLVLAADDHRSGGVFNFENKAERTCLDSPQSLKQYQNLVDKFFHVAYDLPPAAKREQMKHDSNCEVSSADKARLKAVQTIKRATDDSFNYIYSKSEYQRHRDGLKPSFGGLGLALDDLVIDGKGKPVHPTTVEQAKALQDEKAYPRTSVVTDITRGGPAASAGFMKDDVIYQINGADELYREGNNVVQDIRGPVGSPVHVTVLRDGRPVEIDATRGVVSPTSVDGPEWRGQNHDIAYIKVKDFHDNSSEQLEAALKKASNAKAYVIDFRNDPGGEVSEALAAPQYFLKNGTLMFKTKRDESSPQSPSYLTTQYKLTDTQFVTSEGHVKLPADQPNYSESIFSPRKPYLTGGKPVIMVMNGGTGSAAEIAIAAVHDNKAATTLGEPSYGKGIITCNWPLADGLNLRVTCGHYLTPNKQWPGDAQKHRYPLQPDVLVKTPDVITYGVKAYGSDGDAQLNAAIALADRPR